MLDIKEQTKFISNNKPIDESLNCLIEECAELIQSITKLKRKRKSNIEEELGHVYLMLSVVKEQFNLNNVDIYNAINDATLRFSESIKKGC